MLFTALHLVRMLLARRVTGVRWLAWVTGIALLGGLWLVGWLGYWLVWDERAREVALGTARVVDALPIFADPLGRSLLTDATVQPLLFFVVLFAHMLLPLAMGVALWLHLARLARPRWLTARPLTVGIGVASLALSLVLPATSAAAARMGVIPERMSIDAWYLAPLWLTGRLGAGGLWLLLAGGGALAFALPWLLGRRRAPVAVVAEARCNACARCEADCPFGAIHMVPRRDGRGFATVASVDPSRCVGCGVCTGACDPGGINVPGHDAELARRTLDRWLDAAPGAGVAFPCARSAGAGLEVDPETGVAPGLPGYRVMPVPCAGWVHPLMVERAFRHGARCVLVVGCGPVEAPARDGGALLGRRLAGAREPALRAERVAGERVLHVELSRAEPAALRRVADELLAGHPTPPPRPARAGALAVAVALTVLVGAVSVLPLVVPGGERELVVTFKHPGKSGEHCVTLSAEELAARPAHMRQPRVCERGRAAVRLRVTVNGAVALQRSYPPRGLFGDGNSVAAAHVLARARPARRAGRARRHAGPRVVGVP